MKLLALAGDIDAVIAQIRLVTPLKALCQKQGWTLVLKSFHDCSQQDLARADVLVVQRAASSRMLRLQQRMQQLGGAVVYDIDDLLTDVPAHISNQDAVRQRVQLLRRCMTVADIVTVSTKRLGHELGLVQAQVVPNHALAASHASVPAHQIGTPVTLLFASSDHLATDFIYPAVRALHGARVVVVGPPATDFQRAGIAVQAQPLMARADFVAFARSLPNVVAVIPLEDSRFAACKSAVKWFDYAAAGIPTLCSAVSPYLEVVDDGVTGALVANEPKAWQSALQQAIDDVNGRQRMATAAQAHVVAHHSLQHTVDAWQQAVLAARQARDAAPPQALGPGAKVQGAWTSAIDAMTLRLRALNRARLAKRSGR